METKQIDNSANAFAKLPFVTLLVLAVARPFLDGVSGEHFGFVDAADKLVAAAALLLCAYAFFAPKRKAIAPAAKGMALYFAASLLAGVLGQDIFVSAERNISLASNIALAVLCATLARDNDDKRELVGVLVFSAILVSLYGLYQRYSIFYSMPMPDSDRELVFLEQIVLAKAPIEGRIYATLLNPDILAGFLAMTILLAVGYLKAALTMTGKLFAVAAIGVQLFALALTSSVSGWWAAGAGLAVFLAITASGSKKRLYAAIAVALIATMAALFVARSGAYKTSRDRSGSRIEQKISIWKGAAKAAVAHPILGVGPGNFRNPYIVAKDASAPFVRNAHSSILEVAVESGIIGLIGFATIIYFIVVGVRKSLKSNDLSPGDAVLQKGVIAGAAAFFCFALIQSGLDVPGAAGYFWMLVGLIAAGDYSPDKSAFRGKITAAALGIVAVLFAVLNLGRIPGEIYLQAGREAVAAKDNFQAYHALNNARTWRPCDTTVLLTIADAWPDIEQGSKLKLTSLQQALTCSPDNPFVWIRLGEQQYLMNNFTDALTTFDGAVQRAPTYKIAEGWRKITNAKLLISEKKYTEARAEYESVLADFPGHPTAAQGLEEIDQLEKNTIE